MAQTCRGLSARLAPTFRPTFQGRRSPAFGPDSDHAPDAAGEPCILGHHVGCCCNRTAFLVPQHNNQRHFERRDGIFDRPHAGRIDVVACGSHDEQRLQSGSAHRSMIPLARLAASKTDCGRGGAQVAKGATYATSESQDNRDGLPERTTGFRRPPVRQATRAGPSSRGPARDLHEPADDLSVAQVASCPCKVWTVRPGVPIGNSRARSRSRMCPMSRHPCSQRYAAEAGEKSNAFPHTSGSCAP